MPGPCVPWRVRHALALILALALPPALGALAVGRAGAQEGSRSRSREVPRIEVREPTVGPAYPPENIRRVVRRHVAAVRACYARGARDAASPRILSFTIGADGAVIDVRIADEPAGESPVVACLRAEIATWRFPAPPGGGTVRVRYPLTESERRDHAERPP